MKLIVAVDNEWGIGYKGDLLARVRRDLFNFRDITKGHTVVLGYNTLATFPGGRVLKNRNNIILCHLPDFEVEGGTVVHSLDELFEELKKYDTDDIYVIGGASVYRQLLPYCNEAIVTKFKKTYEKDVTIPNLDEDDAWILANESETFFSDGETDTEAGLPFTFCTYKKIK